MKRKTLILTVMFGTILAVALIAAPTTAEEGQAADPGMELYNKKCAMCHGKDGVAKAMAKGSANLNDPEWQKATSQEAVEKVIAEGKNKMPGLKDKLSAEEIKAVAAYTLQLK